MESEFSAYSISKPMPLILVISGLSGAGKDTVINRLKEISPIDFHFVVTCTSRAPRAGEIDGRDYHFLSREKFEAMIANDEMVEYSVVYDDLKGVPKFEIEQAFADEKDIILRVDRQGMLKVRKIYPNAVSIFIVPPDAATWLQRLRARNTDTEEALRIRIYTARQELENINDFDYVVVNDQVDQAVADIIDIMRVEHMRSSNRKVSLSSHE